MPPPERLLCPYCHLGRLRLRLTTYVHLYNGTLVSVPNTPAWECDFCHTLDYDKVTLLRIETLVGQAGPPPNRSRPARPDPPPPVSPVPGGAKQ